MKSKLFLLAITSFMGVGLVGCDSAGSYIPSSIEIVEKTEPLAIGQNYKIDYIVAPATAQQVPLIWTVDDDSVATITDGVLRGLKAGEVKVTVEVKNYTSISDTATFTIAKDVIYPTSVEVSAASSSIAIGGNTKVTASFLPKDATPQSIVWTSLNEDIASVSSSGNVTGNKVGIATIKGTVAGDSSLFDTIDIEVREGAKWTVMLYICGADLESADGQATADLKEIASVAGQTDDVNVIVEAGGASSWKSTYSSVINRKYLNRFHLANRTYVKDEQITKANMGLSSTFQDFLEWGLTSYPAQNTGVILWNHGGGIDGVCFDENYGNDSLTDVEIQTAMKNAFSTVGRTEKLEWIGYDACLMAVQDIASLNADYFNYMVCSEESENGDGWDYDTWVDDLFKSTSTTESILKAIVDGFITSNGGISSSYNDQTLSVLDLSYMDSYVTAWENMATTLSNNFVTSSSGWNTLLSLAKTCKRYGYDSDYGYAFDVFDAHDFIDKMQASSTYKSNTTLMNNITAIESVFSSLVQYESHGKGAGKSYGLCMFMFSSGYYSSSNYAANMTKFTNWRTMMLKYYTK